MNTRQIHIFYIELNHHLTSYCFKISKDLQDICSILEPKFVFVIFSEQFWEWAHLKLFRNNNKNNFAFKSGLQISCKSVQKYWNNSMLNDGSIIEITDWSHGFKAVVAKILLTCSMAMIISWFGTDVIRHETLTLSSIM